MCIFCNIVSGKQKADIVYSGQDLIAFSDINPKAPVHILIVPKKHIESVQKLKGEDSSLVSNLIFAAQRIARKRGIEIGYKLVINCGRQAGQVIDHLHLHLLGGWDKEKE